MGTGVSSASRYDFAKYSDPNGPDGGEWTPYTKENPAFMVFRLDDADAEASGMDKKLLQ